MPAPRVRVAGLRSRPVSGSHSLHKVWNHAGLTEKEPADEAGGPFRCLCHGDGVLGDRHHIRRRGARLFQYFGATPGSNCRLIALVRLSMQTKRRAIVCDCPPDSTTGFEANPRSPAPRTGRVAFPAERQPHAPTFSAQGARRSPERLFDRQHRRPA